jgi:hypothetical protein
MLPLPCGILTYRTNSLPKGSFRQRFLFSRFTDEENSYLPRRIIGRGAWMRLALPAKRYPSFVWLGQTRPYLTLEGGASSFGDLRLPRTAGFRQQRGLSSGLPRAGPPFGTVLVMNSQGFADGPAISLSPTRSQPHIRVSLTGRLTMHPPEGGHLSFRSRRVCSTADRGSRDLWVYRSLPAGLEGFLLLGNVAIPIPIELSGATRRR